MCEFYCYFIPKSGWEDAWQATFRSESVGFQGNPFKLIRGSRSRFSPRLQHASTTPLKFRVERKEDSGGTSLWCCSVNKKAASLPSLFPHPAHAPPLEYLPSFDPHSKIKFRNSCSIGYVYFEDESNSEDKLCFSLI